MSLSCSSVPSSSLLLLLPLPTLLLKFLLFRFKNEFFPEAGNLTEFGVCTAGCNKGSLQGALFLNKLRMIGLQGFFLLDALAMQNSQAELQVADLAKIALALLL